MPTLTVTHEGNELQVEVTEDALKSAGYVEKSEYKDHVSKEYLQKELERTKRRAESNAKDDLRAELIEDDEVIAEIIKKHGKPNEDFEQRLEEHRVKWEKEKLEPLSDKYAKAISRSLDADVLKAAEWSKEAKENPVLWNALKMSIQDRVSFDEEHGFVVNGPNGSPLPGSEDRVYAGIQDLVKAEGDTFKPFLAPPPRNGSGLDSRIGGGGSAARTMTRAEHQALPPSEQMKVIDEGVAITE